MVGMTLFGGRAQKGRTIRPQSKQTGNPSNIPIDRARKALAPGKRISRTGNVYWESRKNRSDKIGKKI